ncbi:MAG: hemerythrin domain-containing protein [Pirellulaceae bacterium]|nr:hemerythrin domain-containing protein [Pirellulaceae bacterium]MDP7018170.1 hemerythrin domain-containing protein [Pirellulaceae bacterium]
MTRRLPHIPVDIHDEHRHLRRLLGQIAAVLSAGQAPRATMASHFCDLRDQIARHFDHEEDGGFFHAELEEAPWLHERANTLLEQHPQFLAMLDDLCSVAQCGADSREWWDEIATLFDSFMRQFSQHEEDENTLMQDALSRDVGAED